MRTDPPEVEMLRAVFQVARGKAGRINAPGLWTVWRDAGDEVRIKIIRPANDVVASAPPSMPPFVA